MALRRHGDLEVMVKWLGTHQRDGVPVGYSDIGIHCAWTVDVLKD
jgi:hypothetical protein